ncbi:MAG: zinc-binding dehydrogenase [Solirubrobacteraceae bacterium]
MRAVVCRNATLEVVDRPAPDPGRGQVRLAVTRCGICGSDLHARTGCDDWAAMAARVGYDRFARSTEPIVFGHEFTGEVAEHGPGTSRRLKEGTPVVALPMLRGVDGIDLTGLSNHAPGGYAEQVLAEETLTMAVPNGLEPDVAAMTEPMAVAHHAVRRGDVGKGDTAIVIGCGPVGLGVILMLKAQGVRTVVASDLSPGRRALATSCGADVVVDPAERSPYEASPARGGLANMADAFELAVSTKERLAPLDRLPLVNWWHAWRLGEALGAAPKHPVIFECVGVPGMIEDVLDGAPPFSRVVVVGVCVGIDRFTPAMGINKEIDLRFVFGYTPLEFRDTLQMLGEGRVDPRPMVTGTVGLDGVADAFDALGDAERHAKILIDPRSTATAV